MAASVPAQFLVMLHFWLINLRLRILSFDFCTRTSYSFVAVSCSRSFSSPVHSHYRALAQRELLLYLVNRADVTSNHSVVDCYPILFFSQTFRSFWEGESVACAPLMCTTGVACIRYWCLSLPTGSRLQYLPFSALYFSFFWCFCRHEYKCE